MKKKLIIVDGPNGVGKTTIIRNLNGCEKIFTPGFTDLGKILRPICRGTSDISVKSKKALIHLFISDRLETLYHIIHDCSESVIVTDRWLVSCLAYQCIDNNLNIDKKLCDAVMNSMTNKEIKSLCDNVYYINCDDNIKSERILKEREENKEHQIDNFIKLDIEKQKLLSKKFDLAFSYFCKETRKKLIKLNNNDESDFVNCFNILQNEINS